MGQVLLWDGMRLISFEKTYLSEGGRRQNAAPNLKGYFSLEIV